MTKSKINRQEPSPHEHSRPKMDLHIKATKDNTRTTKWVVQGGRVKMGLLAVEEKAVRKRNHE
jgi:hypothetical protein